MSVTRGRDAANSHAAGRAGERVGGSLTRYAAFYCEENIWWIAHEPANHDGFVVLVSNPRRAVALGGQRLGAGPARITVWDYHVFFVRKGEAFDYDAVAPMPSPLDRYVSALFLPELQVSSSPYAATISIVPAEAYLARFSSDRSHMLNADGAYLRPPPPWPAIYDSRLGNTLFALVDGADEAVAYHGNDLSRLLE